MSTCSNMRINIYVFDLPAWLGIGGSSTFALSPLCLTFAWLAYQMLDARELRSLLVLLVLVLLVYARVLVHLLCRFRLRQLDKGKKDT